LAITNRLKSRSCSRKREGADDGSDDDELGYEQGNLSPASSEDLFKMHTYRDGILSTRGPYILFPGDAASMRTEGKNQSFLIRLASALAGHRLRRFQALGPLIFAWDGLKPNSRY
jgi:uncharacterized protein